LSTLTGTFVPKNFHSQESSFPGTFIPMSDFKGERSFSNISYLVPVLFLHTYTRSIYLTCSFTHAEQASQVCRPTHVLPRHHRHFAYRPSETSWSRNRSSWNQSMPARNTHRLKGSQDITTCPRPAEACRPIGLGFKPLLSNSK